MHMQALPRAAGRPLAATRQACAKTSRSPFTTANKARRAFLAKAATDEVEAITNGAAPALKESSNGQRAGSGVFDDLHELVRMVQGSDIVEFEVKNKQFSFALKKREAFQAVEVPVQVIHAAPVAAPAPPPAAPAAAAPAASAASAAPAPPRKPAGAKKAEGVEIASPMAGTFYKSPAPGEPQYCKVGDRVTKGQTICIVEAMKLMNEIEAEVSGEVVQFLLENGAPVSPGQALMIVKP